MLPRPLTSPLFPYTTLFRSHYSVRAENDEDRRADLQGRAEAMLREALALNRTLGREQAMAYIYRELAETVDRRSNLDRKSTRLNSSHLGISYAVFCLKKKKI